MKAAIAPKIPHQPHYRMRSRLIHGTFNTKRWDYDHHVIPPLSSSTTFRLSSVERGAEGFIDFGSEEVPLERKVPIYIYDRLDEPTRGMLEENLALAEQGEVCVTFSTGMAAIAAALGVAVRQGQEIIAHEQLYGSTYSLLTSWLPRFGIPTHWCNLRKPKCLRDCVTPKTRVVYFETPTNPSLELIDIAALRREVDTLNQDRKDNQKLLIIVDNTFATPYCQRPLTLGADLVAQSLTKNIGGFGTDMGGAVVGPRFFYNLLMGYRKDFGGVLSPKNAWPILVYGLPTLGARMANQQKTALKVAQFLESHPKVESVFYPGLDGFPQRELAQRQMVDYDGKFAPGSLLYFILKDAPGSSRAADQLVDYVAEHAYTITLAVSLGQIKTLIENPYSMTHFNLPPEEKEASGIHPGGIRLSVGLEDWHDIIDDLHAALEAA
ncbi:MAG: PLP-dependent transferase [Acidobacteria bacterium]|nr:PLP-dependent transferase [Acidobacteriota bacterium]